MSDLFHRDVPTEFILEVFKVMAKANWHIFQVLTKRPSRLLRLSNKISEALAQVEGISGGWPNNIWMGVSIETMGYSWRADYLRKVPASIRFISAEPLLGPLDNLDLTGIHWLIAGGESGPHHRLCDPSWIRALRDKCLQEDVAFFFKQWGGRFPKANGRTIDGTTWDEVPNMQSESTVTS